jgi:hypothetical protein
MIGFFILYMEISEMNGSLKSKHLAYADTLDKDLFYLSVDDALEPRGIDPRSDLGYLRSYRVVPFGTVVLLANVKEYMRANGFGDYDDLYKNPGLRILVKDESFWKIGLLRKYLLEHYRVVTKIESESGANGLRSVRFFVP